MYSKKEQLITRIQSIIRGKLHRKELGISYARDIDRTYESAWLVGNDPKIKGLSSYAAPSGKIALVGTSCLRSLGILCELANPEHIPKLIIVDISNKVISFWRQLRTLAETLEPQNFQASFESFLQDNEHLYRHMPEISNPTVQYENQDPMAYMNSLIAQYGLDYVLSIIKDMVIIGQSWSESSLFVALRNILKLHGIEKTYTYPSNIEACVDVATRARVATSIKMFKPCLSIATNLSSGLPTEVFLRLPETLELSQPVPTPSAKYREIDEKSYRNSGAFNIYLKQNIKRLLISLVSYIDVSNDHVLGQQAKSILKNMKTTFQQLVTESYSDQQKQMITLFLGGVILAMAFDNYKYNYRRDDEYKKYIIYWVSSVREQPISRLSSTLSANLLCGKNPAFLHQVGAKVLAKLSSAFIWNLFNQELNFARGTTQRTFLPSLQCHADKLALLFNFCERYRDDLETSELEVDPNITKLNERSEIKSGF